MHVHAHTRMLSHFLLTRCTPTETEICHKPLFAVAASQLGVSADEIEATVGSLLTLCDRWGGV